MKKTTLLAATVFASTLALAQTTDPHAGHAMPAAAATTPSNAAFEAANAKMHKDMAVPLTGDADRDFLAGSIWPRWY